ncbi:hypothetical protein ANOBCDAF_03425 [Pleomorphomonas sp. T1.2MG-36]|uniref:hypothetical protein n=1 Tax=Pleomorphomonas sp. T1.2MG-36 TaxID=3041167 RepID=UPI0024779E05|nr:hypothetical protein [Pleomorphomonas sp. T1.2MG-36]CAI9415287.1 hypothetical protein ANOBCDAF_03425 [Pleomorphomonas sp. T1.2MG-36]
MQPLWTHWAVAGAVVIVLGFAFLQLQRITSAAVAFCILALFVSTVRGVLAPDPLGTANQIGQLLGYGIGITILALMPTWLFLKVKAHLGNRAAGK